MKKKIILLNDTSLISHYGCKFVSETIDKMINKNKLELVSRFFNEQNYDQIIKRIKNINFDGVIINGEGTIHDKNNYSETILKIVEFIKKNYFVKIFIINSSISNLPNSSLKILRHCDKIYVRESLTKKYLNKHKIKSEIVPDMIFAYNFPKIKKNKSNNIVITDSVFSDTSEKLLKFSKCEKKYIFCPFFKRPEIKYNHNKVSLLRYKYSKLKSHIFLFLFNKEINITKYYLKNDITFFKQLKNSSLNICGRFHGLVISIIFRTPFLVINSNTHKSEGLLIDLKIKNKVIAVKDLKNKHLLKNKKLTKSENKKINKYKLNAKIKINKMFDEIKHSL